MSECRRVASELSQTQHEQWVEETAADLGDAEHAAVLHTYAQECRQAVLATRLDAEVQRYQSSMTAIALSLERYSESVRTPTGLATGGRAGSPALGALMAEQLPHNIATSLEAIEELLRGVRRDIDEAAAVQRMLLPRHSVSINAAAHIASYYRPAGGCGGDWWTVESLPGGRLVVAVGDVTGHGPAAAILTAVAKTAFDRAVSSNPEVTCAEVLATMNQALYTVSRSQKPMSCVVSIIDANAEEMSTANAGHPFPYRLSRERGGSRELGLITARGSQLGVTAEASFDIVTEPVQPGDLLLWYTDGATECRGESGAPFGEKRLRALLRSGHDDAQIAAAIGLVWAGREDRYSELRGAASAAAGSGERRVEMHYIGG